MPVRWPLSSSPGVNAQETAGRLVNAHAEKIDDPEFPVRHYRVPGLREVVDVLAHVHLRGAILVGSTLIAVFDERVYTITVSGSTFTAVNRGALAGTDMVTIAKNSAATPNIVLDCAAGSFNLFTSSAPTAFADADKPATNSVSEVSKYFIWTTGSGDIWASGLNAVTVASNAFQAADKYAGGLLRGVSFRGQFFAFHPSGCSVYRDAGLSPFPLEYVTNFPVGIAGTHAIAGWEPGWASILQWVAGDLTVRRLEGNDGRRVSTHSVERTIQSSANPSLIRCSVAMRNGHAYWIMKSPGEFTWVHNVTTDTWHERASYNQPDFRGSASVKAFDRWLIGDETTGKIGEFTDDYTREFGNPLVWEVQSLPSTNFPAKVMVPRFDLNMTRGVGLAAGEDPIQTNPVVKIEISNDGGRTFSDPVTRELGQQGNYDQVISVVRTGIVKGPGRVYRLKVSDPVHVGIKSAAHAEIPLRE